MKSVITLISVLCFIFIGLAGCSDSKLPKKQKAKKPAESVAKPELPPTPDEKAPSEKESDQESGYVYEQRDRRDPFDPLIKPIKKTAQQGETRVSGTLESYDIGQFTLAAIVKKKREYIALLVAPDNRSFSVRKGNTIGLHKGKVESITENKIVMIEHSRDYRGELESKKVTLELNKGEGE